jgi:hypothetical protein
MELNNDSIAILTSVALLLFILISIRVYHYFKAKKNAKVETSDAKDHLSRN